MTKQTVPEIIDSLLERVGSLCQLQEKLVAELERLILLKGQIPAVVTRYEQLLRAEGEINLFMEFLKSAPQGYQAAYSDYVFRKSVKITIENYCSDIENHVQGCSYGQPDGPDDIIKECDCDEYETEVN